MTPELALTLTGLALLDSVNTSTLFLVMVILLTARRPIATAATYTIGASVSFFALAVGLQIGAETAESAVVDAAQWIRRATLVLLAGFLLYLAHKRLRDRPRNPLTLPKWFGPVTAMPLGAAATVADIPNAFPLFIAIERLLVADLGQPTSTWILLAYTIVYALPIGLAVAAGALAADRARALMRRITDRFLHGVARRSLRAASLYALGGIAAAVAIPAV